MSTHAPPAPLAGLQAPEFTVGQLVAQRPSRARVLEGFGLDYCCGGKKPLSLACRERQLDPAAVLAALEEEARRPVTATPDWSGRPLDELVNHIQHTHHAYLKTELPRISLLAEKVARAHAGRHPELIAIRSLFERLRSELEHHTNVEDRVVFPLCRRLAHGPLSNGGAVVREQIEKLTHEHEGAGAVLTDIRDLTDEYRPPADACNTYRALFSSLAELEADLHQHVHKENNILFPRAVAAACVPAPLDWSI